MKSGAELIAEEREEQIEVHGYPIQHDAEYNDCYELAVVAQCLIMPPNQEVTLSEELNMLNALADSWDQEVLAKMLQKSYKDRLIIAGALLAAEIDRLQYMEEPQDGSDFFEDELAKRFPIKEGLRVMRYEPGTDPLGDFENLNIDLETRSGLAVGEKPGYNNVRFQPVDLSFSASAGIVFTPEEEKVHLDNYAETMGYDNWEVLLSLNTDAFKISAWKDDAIQTAKGARILGQQTVEEALKSKKQ